jgi:hypothetical protein
MNAGTGVSGTVANGTAHANSTAEIPTTMSAAARCLRVAGMVERKISRSSPVCIVISGKLAANAPIEHRRDRKGREPIARRA